MKINIFFAFISLSILNNAYAVPNNFYKKENSRRFVKTIHGNYFSIEKFDGDLVRIYEEKDINNNRLIGKYEAVFINPVDGNFSYNNFYQINKNYSYKNGKIYSVNYEIGKMETCFVKCGDEIYYTEGKVVKKNKYPACLSLFDMEKRVLKFNVKYVKDNCS
ncbi:hypothetical protein [Acinetobacter pragensis]|uniref:hypothetical protein n=1 Tax=Acinetobacter pragensis TaxID=1806892 RepID=UPI0033421437